MTSTTLRPETWDAFIGQERMKARLGQHIQAANEREEQLDHVLLLGPAGSGKTSLARLIADEHHSPFHEVIMGQLKPAMLQDILLNTEGVLFLDEIHKLPPAQQEILLPVLLDKYVQMPYGREDIRFPLTIIAATTERDRVLRTIRERFKIAPEFDPYTDEQMAQIMMGMVRRLEGCPIDEESAKILARATVGQPRQAEMIVFCARDLNSNDPDEILAFAGITPEGLTVLHLRYLSALRQNNNGICGAEVLASSLRLDKASVVDLERVLVSLNMIEYTPKGRALKHLGNQTLTKHKEML